MINTDENLVASEEIDDKFFHPPSYIFQTSSDMISFVMVQTELEQLHDYCLLCQDATDKKLKSYRRIYSTINRGRWSWRIQK